MKAAIYTRFGPPEVLALHQVPKPEPREDEVLIQVRAMTVTSAECAMRRGEPLWGRIILGLRRPRKRMRTLGTELAGRVEAVGAKVTRFRPGDEVFGFTGFRLGANAEYVCLAQRASLELKPVNLGFEEAAAAVDGASTALYFLRKAGLRAGHRVLVYGASGSIGTYAVQLAKHFGAHVTAVCGPRNADLVAELGADEVIDYTKEDYSRSGARYDIVFDTLGKSSFAQARTVLTRQGRYAPTTGLGNTFLSLGTSLSRGRKVVTGMSVDKNDSLALLKGLIEAEQLRVVIDRRYPFDQLAEAHRYVETGHKRGNVVITID
ncbi:NAD(P)-dependent alcohol dehydrogenase [Nonomuraea sp. NN258]|uniref:NAD(P)-dependent alcohol dehydrogenase n=1 Tax=Nonomuraea antri TaxID=2730852 RepID=UPI001567DFEE|nr:NAD(P)-dependent alcohol dehydrogenase [Nonomuraea antri]NRQ40109.1 NAD(P)-dependent alcohol dehydrogenase [Nonomuraea antri]